MVEGVVIVRDVSLGRVPFKDAFRGFENVDAVRLIFGASTDEVLSDLYVDIEDGRGYMRINDREGSVTVNSKYLREGDETHLYLDVVHELVHIKQRMEGKELWDRRYAYVDRPTEVEAYKVVLDEARRIGLGSSEIVDYLKVDWVTEEEFLRLLTALGVESNTSRSIRRPQ